MIYFALHTKQSNSYQIMRPGFVSVYYTGISTKSLVHKFRMQFSKVAFKWCLTNILQYCFGSILPCKCMHSVCCICGR